MKPTSLRCPACHGIHAVVQSTKPNADSVKRIYLCPCGQTFATREVVAVPREAERAYATRLAAQSGEMAMALGRVLGCR